MTCNSWEDGLLAVNFIHCTELNKVLRAFPSARVAELGVRDGMTTLVVNFLNSNGYNFHSSTPTHSHLLLSLLFYFNVNFVYYCYRLFLFLCCMCCCKPKYSFINIRSSERKFWLHDVSLVLFLLFLSLCPMLSNKYLMKNKLSILSDKCTCEILISITAVPHSLFYIKPKKEHYAKQQWGVKTMVLVKELLNILCYVQRCTDTAGIRERTS